MFPTYTEAKAGTRCSQPSGCKNEKRRTSTALFVFSIFRLFSATFQFPDSYWRTFAVSSVSHSQLSRTSNPYRTRMDSIFNDTCLSSNRSRTQIISPAMIDTTIAKPTHIIIGTTRCLYRYWSRPGNTSRTSALCYRTSTSPRSFCSFPGVSSRQGSPLPH